MEVFAGATGRRLKLGIHRPEGTAVCNFRLVQEYVVDSVPVGRSTVRLALEKTVCCCCFFAVCDFIVFLLWQILIPEASRLVIQAGDHFGFTWLDLGVISYERVATDNFCELNVSKCFLLTIR